MYRTFRKALANGNVQQMRKCIENGISLKYRDNRNRNWLLICVLDSSSETSIEPSIYFLLDTYSIQVNAEDVDGWNVLHYVSGYGYYDLLLGILKRDGVQVKCNAFGYDRYDFKYGRKKDTSLFRVTANTERDRLRMKCWNHLEGLLTTWQVKMDQLEYNVKDGVKIHFKVPRDHSELDRIRMVDTKMECRDQHQCMVMVPCGDVGSITLDSEWFKNTMTSVEYKALYESKDSSGYTVVGIGERFKVKSEPVQVEYDIRINYTGPIGLTLMEKDTIVVCQSAGPVSHVGMNDALLQVGSTYVANAGLSFTCKTIANAKRPLTLKFRKSDQGDNNAWTQCRSIWKKKKRTEQV